MVRPRASRVAPFDMSRLWKGQFSTWPPSTYLLPTTMSAPPLVMRSTISDIFSGGWLRSASMTTNTEPDAALNPSMTAVERPSFPALWTTLTLKLFPISSARAPVPSGLLSSTMTIS